MSKEVTTTEQRAKEMTPEQKVKMEEFIEERISNIEEWEGATWQLLEKAIEFGFNLAASPDAGDWKSVEDGLENMTEEKLISVFKAVSLIDLSDCSFEYGVDAENKHWCNAFENGRVVDGIVFDGNLFHMMNNNATFSPLNPMYSAYKALTLPSPPKNNKS